MSDLIDHYVEEIFTRNFDICFSILLHFLWKYSVQNKCAQNIIVLHSYENRMDAWWNNNDKWWQREILNYDNAFRMIYI